jgi:hypothetical protein
MKKIFVAEINGRGIAAISAESRAEAEEQFMSPWFKEDLMCLENEGKPLWPTAGDPKILLREPLPEEAARWEKSRDASDADEEDWLVFLVPVTDPTDPPSDDGVANYDRVITLH